MDQWCSMLNTANCFSWLFVIFTCLTTISRLRLGSLGRRCPCPGGHWKQKANGQGVAWWPRPIGSGGNLARTALGLLVTAGEETQQGGAAGALEEKWNDWR